MRSGTLHVVTAARAASRTGRPPHSPAAKLRLGREPAAPPPDEPTAVLVAGTAGSGRSAVVGALLGSAGPLLDLPAGSYLVTGHGRGGEPAAYVPGFRHAQPGRAGEPAEGAAATARPPRRIEMTLPDPLLRHLAVLESPDADALGVAGTRILLDVAQRGGALVYVTAADRSLSQAEVDLIAEVAGRGVTVFFALTPGRGGCAGTAGTAGTADADADAAAGTADTGAVQVADANPLGAHRADVIARAPALGDAPWFAVDPVAGDVAYLRRALVEWAGVEGLRRASSSSRTWPGPGRTVRVAARAVESDWQEMLERVTRTSAHAVRQRLAIELANIHLRCVQEIVFGTGPAGMPAALDRELHSLSLLATAECDAAVNRMVEAVLGRVLRGEPGPGVRRRVLAAVRRCVADDPSVADLDRVLLVTSTGGVVGVLDGAFVALPAYLTEPDPATLPPVGLALSDGCYLRWRGSSADGEVDEARSWLQRSLRGVERDFVREVARRCEAVRRALVMLVGESVDRGTPLM